MTSATQIAIIAIAIAATIATPCVASSLLPAHVRNLGPSQADTSLRGQPRHRGSHALGAHALRATGSRTLLEAHALRATGGRTEAHALRATGGRTLLERTLFERWMK